MGYKIGSFNLCRLGMRSLAANNKRDLSKIANIIREEGFDVVALQEIFSEGKAITAVSENSTKYSIMRELGNDWDFKWADVDCRGDCRGEGYGYLWNTRRLKLAENNSGKIFEPRTWERNKKDLKRKPFYARFVPVDGPFVELRLVCVHTYYGDDNKDDRGIRKIEIDALREHTYPEIADKRYGENRVAYTILLGDYNAEVPRAEIEEQRKKQNEKRKKAGKTQIKTPLYIKEVVESNNGKYRGIKTVQTELTTLCSGGDAEYAHSYDHFT